MSKFDLGTIFTVAEAVPRIVNAFKTLFGKNNGAAKMAAAKQATKDVVVVTNAIADRTILDSAAADALVQEIVQTAYEADKVVEASKLRIAELEAKLKALVARNAPGADGTP